MKIYRTHVAALLLLVVTGCGPSFDDDQPITISVIGTNDVHGALLPVDGNRGLTTFSGYVNNLRRTRAADGGAVVLIDAGDMWQGTLESNLSEGASVVAAYNAIGYDAAAIGNHEFDFGPVGERATPADDTDDARGALKLRASEADFPLLAANIIDQSTGQPLDWENVRPSVLFERGGIKIGVLGLLAENGLTSTIAANVRGLSLAPLALTATREARKLRDAGAELVIITAHAGARCETFDDPQDLTSCDLDGEIMRVALDLPVGLVDHIIAGHIHQGIAHEVNGIAITSSFSRTAAFGRVDFVFDRRDHSLLSRTIHPPQRICGYVDQTSGDCVPADEVTGSSQLAVYSGHVVAPNPRVVEIAERAEDRAAALKSEKLGVYLETPITREGRGDSAIGHLFTDVVHDAIGGDLVIHNVVGGIRADLPAGELTYGAVYEMYPFDNLGVKLGLSGAELREVLARQVFRGDRRAGISGITVSASCGEDGLELTMRREDGSEITDDESLRVTTTDFLAMGGDDIFTTVMPEGGYPISQDAVLVREAIADWMRANGGRISADTFADEDNPKWDLPEPLPENCRPAQAAPP
ncbi:MAG: 5'-nucleotidase C-terminal domain-containing protein [Woeseiaceae bacterium]|nr:5'-nucleotidase C-terminal domain-containing protein [Woeseiaceae bacterium]